MKKLKRDTNIYWQIITALTRDVGSAKYVFLITYFVIYFGINGYFSTGVP